MYCSRVQASDFTVLPLFSYFSGCKSSLHNGESATGQRSQEEGASRGRGENRGICQDMHKEKGALPHLSYAMNKTNAPTKLPSIAFTHRHRRTQ